MTLCDSGGCGDEDREAADGGPELGLPFAGFWRLGRTVSNGGHVSSMCWSFAADRVSGLVGVKTFFNVSFNLLLVLVFLVVLG